jgi:thiamine-phosphate pyrophosphorylase
MVTDRARGGADDDLVARVGAAARAGVHLVQVRDRDLEAGTLADLVARCVGAVHGTATRVVVNERLDVALAAGAHGVHLRADSYAGRRARQMTPRGFLVGRSAHDGAAVARTADAGGVDYIVFGTVFPTASKAGREAAGLDALAAASSATPVPVLAIGGVTLAHVAEVAAAGAAGFAAIGLFAEGPVEELADVVREARRLFGEAGSAG